MAHIKAETEDGIISISLEGDGQELVSMMGYICKEVCERMELDVDRAMYATAQSIKVLREEPKWTQ